jgi:hypothetical protein
MAAGALCRSGLKIFMAVDTLEVKCIGSRDHFRIFNFRFIMAVQACLIYFLLLGRGQMTFAAGDQ